MKARILAVLLAVALLVSSPALGTGHNLLESVRPIQMVRENVLANICTAASISETNRYWLTAAHCVPEIPIYIMGEQATWPVWDEAADLAVLQTATVSAPALKLAEVCPTHEAVVKAAGYPHGNLFPFVVIGTVAATHSTLPAGTDRPFMVYQLPGAGGNSGSPVVNAAGEVVSVMQVGPGGSAFSPIMGGATCEAVQKLKAYFQ